MSTSARDIDSVARGVLDSLVEGCQVIGFDWRYLYVNEALTLQGKQSQGQLLGRTMMECYAGIESTAMFSDLRRCMSERAHHRMENEFTFPDGSQGWFELRFVPVAAGVAVLSLDITERKRTEQALRLLIDGVRDYGMFVVDPAGRILTWNAGAERLKGYSTEEILGQDSRRFYPPADVAAGKPDLVLEAARAHGRAEDEGWRVRKDGTRFWANVVVTSLSDSTGMHLGFAKISRDLTERRKLEDQVRQAQKLEAIGSLAGGVAHDFNNVLSVILSYSEMLIEDLRPADPMRSDLEEIKAAAMRATDLTHQLLAFGRQQILQPKPVNLNDIVTTIERMLRRLVGESVEFTFLPDSTLGAAHLDPSQVDQVVINLVVNARDAMLHGGKLTIETTNVELDHEYAAHHVGVAPGPYVMLAVSDTGDGMDAETQKRIFEPFFTTKKLGKGTGLGLSTVFGIVRQSGGHIWVYSEPGRGTVFKIYFPRTDQAAVVTPPVPLGLPRDGTETILLVEDDERVRSLARTILQRHGYHVLEAQSGGDALLICEQHGATIHLLLTDVVMPRMSGRQLAERLRSIRPAMKVLYMSGYTDNSIVHHGVLDSDVNFLQKPITPESLTRKVREVIDSDGPR